MISSFHVHFGLLVYWIFPFTWLQVKRKALLFFFTHVGPYPFTSPATPRMNLNSSTAGLVVIPSIQLLGIEMLLHFLMGPEVLDFAKQNKLVLSLGIWVIFLFEVLSHDLKLPFLLHLKISTRMKCFKHLKLSVVIFNTRSWVYVKCCKWTQILDYF